MANVAYPGPADPDSWITYLKLSLAGAVITVLAGRVGDLYGEQAVSKPFLCMRRAIGYWIVAVTVLLGAIFFFHSSDRFSRGWAGLWLASGIGVLCLSRVVLGAKIAWWRSCGWMRQRAVVIGPRAHVADMIALAPLHLTDFYHIVGAFDDSNTDIASDQKDECTVGTMNALMPFVRNNFVETVIVCMNSTSSSVANTICMELADLPVEVLICPDFSHFALPLMGMKFAGGLSLLQVSCPPLGDSARIVKGLEDRIIAGAMLLVLAPVMLAAAVAIKLDSRGPVFFRQERFGFNNRPISILKFRSMSTALGDPTGAERTVRGDRRVTRVGRVLRATSVDELPQLLNVLRGEMSVVGPRAHAIKMKVQDKFYYDAVNRYAARHRVKPGITGLAQINGLRGEIDTIEKAHARIHYDLEYISHWSLWLDLKIILLTPFRALRNSY
jgi:Undecaprenyl-phosphate glucose phosphotransferase